MFLKSVATPVGPILLCSLNGITLDSVFFEQTTEPWKNVISWGAVFNEKKTAFVEASAWFEQYMRGEKPRPDQVELNPKGSEYQLRIWSIVQTIPYGETMTYKEIGEAYKKKYNVEYFSLRSVGAAIGKNPYAIIIPCHRVIGADGSLRGYAAGLKVKKALLDFEKKTK